VEGCGTVEGLGKTFWAAAMGDIPEHAIKIGMISRKITRCSPTPEAVGSDVLHVLVHGVELSTKELVVFESAGRPKWN
jgi:hypothetical protein